MSGLVLDWSSWWSVCKQADNPLPYYDALNSNNGKGNDFGQWCETIHPKTLAEVMTNAPVEVLVLFVWRFAKADVENLMQGYTIDQCREIGAAWNEGRRTRGMPTSEPKKIGARR